MKLFDFVKNIRVEDGGAGRVRFQPAMIGEHVEGLFRRAAGQHPAADRFAVGIVHFALQEMSAKTSAHDVHFVQVGSAPVHLDTFMVATQEASFGLECIYLDTDPDAAAIDEERAASVFEVEDLKDMGIRQTKGRRVVPGGCGAFVAGQARRIGLLVLFPRDATEAGAAARELQGLTANLAYVLAFGRYGDLAAIHAALRPELPAIADGLMVQMANSDQGLLILEGAPALWERDAAPLRAGLETFERKLSERRHILAPVMPAAGRYAEQPSLVTGFQDTGEDSVCVIQHPESLASLNNAVFVPDGEAITFVSQEMRFEMPRHVLACVHGARLYGDVVIDRAGAVVSEVSEVAGAVTHDGQTFMPIDPTPDVSLKGVWTDLRTYYPNHSHWLLESLRRLRFFTDMGVKPNLILYDGATKSQRQYLDVFGYGDVEIVTRSRTQVVECERLLSIGPHDLSCDRRSAEYFERIAGKVPAAAGSGLLYVARTDATAYRNLVNEDAIIRVAESLGFEIVIPSELSAEQKIALFKSARLIAGPLGAGLLYSAFSPRGIDMIMLTNHHYLTRSVPTMAVVKGFNTLYLMGPAVDCHTWIWDLHHSNFFIDPARFRVLVEMTLRKQECRSD